MVCRTCTTRVARGRCWPQVSLRRRAASKRRQSATWNGHLSQQRPNRAGSPKCVHAGEAPFTHTIAYAIRGFLECGVLLGERTLPRCRSKAARAVAAVQRTTAGSPERYARTGRAAQLLLPYWVAQMSLNWIRLAQETGATALRDNASRAIAYVKGRQRLDDRDPIVRGAIAGSAPIWGVTRCSSSPNWAAKFFADAVMMDLDDTPVPPVHGESHGRKDTVHV